MPRDELARADHPSWGGGALPRPNFAHLRSLTSDIGLWEHADFETPRPAHGYCNDDNGRALVIISRERDQDLTDLLGTYLRFVLDARKPDGTFHNRRGADGSWSDEVGSDDSQGRVWWGLGALARRAPEDRMRTAALDEFATCDAFRSTHLRSNAYAALGAAEVLTRTSDFTPANEMLDRTSSVIATAARSTIPWPESRLTYDNARIPEALIAAGSALGDERRTSLGLRLLEWLVGNESRGDQFSFTPVGGRVPGPSGGPGYDQQPLEAWAMAEACLRAEMVTGDADWGRIARRAGRWLLGWNDAGATMYQSLSGGTYDGLTPDGVNVNQGAESTLAGLGVLQAVAESGAGSRADAD